MDVGRLKYIIYTPFGTLVAEDYHSQMAWSAYLVDKITLRGVKGGLHTTIYLQGNFIACKLSEKNRETLRRSNPPPSETAC
jgi:hypothetical protein